MRTFPDTSLAIILLKLEIKIITTIVMIISNNNV